MYYTDCEVGVTTNKINNQKKRADPESKSREREQLIDSQGDTKLV